MFTKSYQTIDSPLAGKIKILFLIMLLLIAAVPISSPPLVLGGRGQRSLSQLALAQPNAVVQVIVQKTTDDDTLEKLVIDLGGTIIKNLYAPKTLAVRLPARALPQLTASPVVRWITLDGLESCFATETCQVLKT